MYRFFINRPIVAMVIAILMVLVGLVSMVSLPVAQYPNLVPPEMQIRTTFVGADAQTVASSVATPIEEQMSGVDNMNYMYSINANNGQMTMVVDFDVKTDPNIDQVLTQLRETQADPQLPVDVRNFGVTLTKSPTSPLMLITLYSPGGTHDETFLANYVYINLADQITSVPGIGSVQVFGAGQYAMRIWVKPDRLAQLSITVNDIISALNSQNTVNPAGQVGGPPAASGEAFTYTVRAQGRLVTAEEFGNIILRANPDGSLVQIKDVARVELGAQVYNLHGRLNGKPAAILALYQLPGSNALDAAKGVRKFMEQAKRKFPTDLDYAVSLDTTLAVSQGIKEITKTLWQALLLVILVVFVFLQSWRTSLIPLLAVPVSLVGTFTLFPMVGFSINTLSLFGLVLAIGLVVDDAIVVVEAVERHIEEGMAPPAAALQAMKEVSGPVVAIALILAAVFIPTVFISGITGRLYQQFAVTIAISVIISAFNALSLSPALAALLLRPRERGVNDIAGPGSTPDSPRTVSILRRLHFALRIPRSALDWFFARFNGLFGRATHGYVHWSGVLLRKWGLALLLLLAATLVAFALGKRLPQAFLPEEDQGYIYVNVQLPLAASLDRTDEFCRQVEEILRKTPGVQSYTTVVGFSLLSFVQSTYNAFFFVTLKPWDKRTRAEEQYQAIQARLNREFATLPGATAFTFPPPAIPGVGTSGGFTVLLQDRSGSQDPQYLTRNLDTFIAAARHRPEIAMLTTTALPSVPQLYIEVDRAKALSEGVNLAEVYRTMQTFLGGYFVNYFNRFGRQWQVYVEAETQYRGKAENVGLFYVRNSQGESVPLSTLTRIEPRTGPEFILHHNEYPAAQINGSAAPGYSSAQATRALEEVFAQNMPKEMGFAYLGMSFQEQKAAQGISPIMIFGLSLVFVFLILAALYSSWSLPFSVLLSTPVAVFGAYLALYARSFQNNVYVQIGLLMLIGLAAKNAILIIEFAKSEYESGRSLTDAALAGARIRLRPIMMTSFAFVLGCVPLWLASGSGGASRQTLGTTVIGGMLSATLLGIFIVPVAFFVVERLATRFGRTRPQGEGARS